MTTESDSVDILSKRDSSQEFNDNTGDEIEGLIDISLNISDEELNEQILEIESIVENDIQIQYKSYENRLKQEFMKWSVVPVFKTITDYNGINELESTRITEDNDHSLRIGGDIFELTVFKDFLNNMIPQWNTDSIIMDLLTVIILFNPNRPNLRHKHYVNLEQQLYIYLLQRYLLLKYKCESESQTNLSKLMQCLSDLRVADELHRQHELSEYEPHKQYYGPLFKEIFDF
ncbi:unnamed protein product [Oppiella nova]|uniref:NR LBD domain-containing protein n=1 Tax=Oppiella nova TaxID=334625 RepID=A0A7R9QWW4_9ACAR|nr:unnamed protein product [Oppiella nova]CAG2177376.1 unnamed protein product [Oppiella nova]